jgi:RNA polymerase sigma factor (TIGR02999 family)
LTSPPSPTKEVTELLLDWGSGDRSAFDKLMSLVYDELRRLAHQYMKRERGGHTLQTTALVNEAYLRLIDQTQVRWQNRAHFFGISARLMRHILVEHARSHARLKRGGGALRVSLDEAAVVSEGRAAEILALDEALASLEAVDPRRCQVVELRYFSGLNNEETAEALGISPNTVVRDWNMAKAWLRREISKG